MKPKDKVRRRSTGETGTVISIEGDYADVVIGDQTVFVHVDELEVLPGGPVELLADGYLGGAEAYALRLQALYLRHAYRFDELSGLSNARIEPALHQVYIAHRVMQKLYPRMILADEVGLGKTIEAGLIIKELRARQMIERVLIVCPASLQWQWKQELSSKFNEDFELFDGSAVKFLGKGGENPWLKRDNVITSLPFASNPSKAEKIIEAGWDLVVFDEAHRVRRTLQSGSKVKTTRAYELADELKENLTGLLLLSATPMQLHPFELYSLIELVEPGLFPGFGMYESRRKQLPDLNELVRAVVGWTALKPHEKDFAIEHHAGLLRFADIDPSTALKELESPARRQEVMDSLSEAHPLSGVLVRNRKRQVLETATQRLARRFLIELTDEERQLYEDVSEYLRDVYNAAESAKNKAIGFLMVTYHKMLTSSSTAIHHSLEGRLKKLRAQRQAAEELKQTKLTGTELEDRRDAEELSTAIEDIEAEAIDIEALEWEIEQLQALVDRLSQSRDSKAHELLKALAQIFDDHPDEKLIIFTQFIQTQEFLALALETNGYRVASFNGSMTLDAKEEAVKSFRNEKQILISTEAGGEGRNFQFCHLMVNYDLPWNPMRVEQRVGRLDRIGQKKDVYIYNLACAGTVEERVLDVLDTRIGLFEESVGALDPILGEVEAEIERIVMADALNFDGELGHFQSDVDKKVLEARAKEEAWADLALDRSSFRRDEAQELLDKSPLARWTDLQAFISRTLDYYGGSLNEHTEGGDALSLSVQLKNKIKSKDGVVRGTFDPEVARTREELPFFAFGHETVDQLVSVAAHETPQYTAARRVPGVPGGVWVEVFYELIVEGVKPMGRFIHHLVNQDGEVRSSELQAVPASGNQVSDAPVPGWAPDALRASRLTFEKTQTLIREEARRAHEEVKEFEIERARRIFDYRRDRLENIVRDQWQWIAEKEQSGSSRDQRILPARKGQLRKNEQRLKDLDVEFADQTSQIENSDVGVSGLILAAGVVIGDD